MDTLQSGRAMHMTSNRRKKRERRREERIVVMIVVLRACNTPLIVRQVCVHSECNISCRPRAAHVPLSVCFGLHCHHGYKRGARAKGVCRPVLTGEWRRRRWVSRRPPFITLLAQGVNNVPVVDN